MALNIIQAIQQWRLDRLEINFGQDTFEAVYTLYHDGPDVDDGPVGAALNAWEDERRSGDLAYYSLDCDSRASDGMPYTVMMIRGPLRVLGDIDDVDISRRVLRGDEPVVV